MTRINQQYYPPNYDLFNISATGVGTAATDLGAITTDGYTERVQRLTLTNKGAAGLVTVTVISSIAGNSYTNTVLEYELGATTSVELDGTNLALAAAAGSKFQVSISAGTLDAQATAYYTKGNQ